MALQARRFHGKPLLQPTYNFRDVPYCSRDLSGSTISIVTDRQHLVNSIAELTLLCSEAARRKISSKTGEGGSSGVPSTKKTTKPLSIEYIFDRIDTDDPLWGLMVRTDTPMSIKGRVSNMKSSPHWKRGMLQGFITMTTFTNWQSSFRFDSLHEMAFGQDDDDLEDQMKAGMRKFDEDGTFADELETCVKGGNPHVEGIVYPRIAEVSLFGGLGCGKQLLRLLVEHLECLKATARANYDYIILQATENSIPFYESMGFTRVGCVQGKAASPNQYHSNPVEEYRTKKNGETPNSIAKEFGVDVWDVVFLNKPLYPELVQKSWLKLGTTIFVPKVQTAPSTKVAAAKTNVAAKWYTAEENETPRGIAKKFKLNFTEFIEANKKRHPDLTGHSKLMEGTRIQISRFDLDEGDTIAYSHWTFPDADQEDNEPSYMMALKLDRKKGNDARERPVADSLAVPIQQYSPESSGAKDLLIQPSVPSASAPLAPVFTKKLKEPVKPKRPMTAYMHFTCELRTNMAEEFTGMSFGEINTIIVDKWKALSDRKKIPYQEMFEKSRAKYDKAMTKYNEEMNHFKRQGTQETVNLGGEVDTSLLEKVVKLKTTDGISGASKAGYYYVLTFIPDLQWVHLIPMRKVGVFGPENSDACGRPIWMIVGEDEGKEIDTTAAVCQPVTALVMRNSADADDEQWDIYDNGETPPPSRLAPISSQKVATSLPGAPQRPKKPCNSFALFCSDAKVLMKAELENKPMVERTKLIAERWREMEDDEKEKYRRQHSKASEKHKRALKRYKEDLAKFQRKNANANTSSSSVSTSSKTSAALSSKTPKSTKKIKPPASNPTPKCTTGSQKKKRGRPRIYPESEIDDTPAPKSKRGRVSTSKKAIAGVHTTKSDPLALEGLLGTLKDGSKSRSPARKASPRKLKRPAGEDIILSLHNESYREVMYQHFNFLPENRDKEKENEVCDEVFHLFKQKMGEGGKFYKSPPGGSTFEVTDEKARQKIKEDIGRRRATAHKWMPSKAGNTASSSVSPKPSLTPTRKAKVEERPKTSCAVAANQSPTLSPSRYPRRKSKSEMYPPEIVEKVVQKSKQGISDDDDEHIPSMPAEELPEGWIKRRIPRSDPRDPRVDTRWYSPELNVKFRHLHAAKAFAQRVKKLGKGEAAAMQSPEKKTKPKTKPLAPIFLKDYGKKKKAKTATRCNAAPSPSVDIEEPERRYPGRKRKQIHECLDDSHFVSDASSSETLFEQPRRKKARAR